MTIEELLSKARQGDATAKAELRARARNGEAGALRALGGMYAAGEGLPRNGDEDDVYELGEIWCQAAKNGDKTALGKLLKLADSCQEYSDEEESVHVWLYDVFSDGPDEAATLFREFAEQGDGVALKFLQQEALGESGHVGALRCLVEMADAGHEGAREALRALWSELEREDDDVWHEFDAPMGYLRKAAIVGSGWGKKTYDAGLAYLRGQAEAGDGHAKAVLAGLGGTTALTLAARNENLEELQELLAAGEDVNETDAGGDTALTVAARADNAGMVQALLAAGADPNAQDGEGRTARDYAEAWSTPAPSLVSPPSGEAGTFTNSIGMEFARIPAGTFQMGAADDDDDARDNEKPRHEVTISRALHLGRFPVTQKQWRAVMGENPSYFKGPDRPVENVCWEDAQEFIAKLNAAEGHDRYRLPTEAEWEYACRAGGGTKYSFGDDADELGNHAWYGDNSGDKTRPVGRKQPNAWGLHDMHGNVWEWCEDRYGKYGAKAVVDPQGPGAGEDRVLRGGGWFNDAKYCRSAIRYGGGPGNRYDSTGFRLALSPGH